MNWEAFFSALAGAAVATGIGTSILGLLLRSWIDHRLAAGRDAEARASAQRQKIREESRAVAEILAEWTRCRYTGQFSNEDRWKLQTTYWKNILGLDRRLVTFLLPRLANAADAVSVQEIIVQARKLLLDLEEPDLVAKDLNNWLPQNESVKSSPGTELARGAG